MELTPQALAAAFYGFNTLFKGALYSTPTYLDPIFTEKTSAGEVENYAFLAKIPQFRAWVGERVYHNLASYVQTLTNLAWEDSVKVDKYKIADDQLGVYTDGFAMLGMAAKQLWDVQGTIVLQAGGAVNTYDAVPFFSASHPINPYLAGSAVQSNNFTSTPLTAANYRTVRQTMMGYVGEDGSPIGIIPDTLIVGPALEGTGKDIVQAGLLNVPIANGMAGTNVNAGTAKLMVVPRLVGTSTVPAGLPGAGTVVNNDTTWYLACTSLPVKPLIKQVRQAPTMLPLDMPFLDHVANMRELRYIADARGAVGYGLWQSIARAAA